MVSTAHEDAAHVSAHGIAALEGLAASLGPAQVGDCAAILLAGLHAGAASERAQAAGSGGRSASDARDRANGSTPMTAQPADSAAQKGGPRRGLAA